jgi:hypothetical protein
VNAVIQAQDGFFPGIYLAYSVTREEYLKNSGTPNVINSLKFLRWVKTGLLISEPIGNMNNEYF